MVKSSAVHRLVGGQNVGAVIYQQSDHLLVAELSRQHQGCSIGQLHRFDIRTALQQQGCHRQSIVARGHVQRRVAEWVRGCLDLRPGVEQQPRDLGIARKGGNVQGRAHLAELGDVGTAGDKGPDGYDIVRQDGARQAAGLRCRRYRSEHSGNYQDRSYHDRFHP